MVRGQENKDCKCDEFNLFSLSKERLTDDIITVYKYLHGENTFDNQGFFSSTDKDITKCGRWMLKLEKFQFKGINFMRRMINLWNNLTRITAKLSLEICNSEQDVFQKDWARLAQCFLTAL